MLDLLADLRQLGRRMPAHEVVRLVAALSRAAAAAGPLVTRQQRQEIADWMERARTPHPPADAPQKTKAAAAGDRGRVQTTPAAAAPAAPDPASAERRPVPHLAAVTEEPRERTENRSDTRGALEPQKITEIAAAVRGALKKAARERATTSWSQLRRQLGSALPALQPGDQVEVLVEVDRHTPPDEPLLASLIAVNDTSPRSRQVYQRLACRLDRDPPLNPKVARSWWQTEVLQLHQLWRHR
ncbi:hypothetical protein ABT104_06185 [Streptomyces mobaraensis]|uniref:hypothetical protein n=1 Tax=Streptomyces mobaraensis TaxID=35621 RepID=UPI0033242264